MGTLFFGDWLSGITTSLALGLLVWLGMVITRRGKIRGWGLRLLIAVVWGTALSALSATRDAFMMNGAVFAMPGFQSLLCMGLGIVIYGLGIIAMWVHTQAYRKFAFLLTAALLGVQIATIEMSRVVIWLGGAA